VTVEATPATDAELKRLARIKSERVRLNRNALNWQRERAAGGSATAQRSLAMRYLTGDGVEIDEARGMDLLRKGAAGGDSAAQKELAKREPAKKE
jgi:TPR repeat protein